MHSSGWLRASVRAIDSSSPHHREYIPYRKYESTDVQYIKDEEPVEMLVELWPTACVVPKGGKVIFEVSQLKVEWRSFGFGKES
jgi:hypothetical protein